MGFIWFWLVAVMLVAYVLFDGFDLGVGILHPFLARTEEERQLMLRAIGPVGMGTKFGYWPAEGLFTSLLHCFMRLPSAGSIWL
jgi:hypothetical protein